MFENKFNYKEFIKNILIGILLGFTIMVPGLSGSIIAIILKVYDRLINLFANIKSQFKKNFIFLLSLLIGGIIGFFLGILLIKFLFAESPFFMTCFFSGLMIGSYPVLLNKVKNKINIKYFVIGFLTPIIFIIISILNNIDHLNGINNNISYDLYSYIKFFIIGILLAITQLVPGLSATVLLMIIGYYSYFISIINFQLLNDFKLILVIVFVILGLIIGMLLFSKIIDYFMKIKYNIFNNIISGLSLGSILCVYFNSDCFVFYKSINKSNMLFIVLICLILIILGIIVSLSILDIYNKRRSVYEKE